MSSSLASRRILRIATRASSVFLLAIFTKITFAQTGTPVNGVTDNYEGTVALTHATIFKDYQTKLTDATLIIEKGKITAIGNNIKIPAVVKDQIAKEVEITILTTMNKVK